MLSQVIKKIKRKFQRFLGNYHWFHKYYLNRFMKANFSKNYDFVLQSQWYDQDQISAYQSPRFQEMIQHVYTNVPYYRNLFSQLKLHPAQFHSIQDLRRIPIINKNEVEKNHQQFKADNSAEYYPKTNKTSGSTGKPFKILIDKDVDILTSALVWRHYNWAGCQFHHKSVYMGPPFDYETGHIDNKNLYTLDATEKILKVNTALLSEETLSELCRLFEQYSPDHIHAYPSFMLVFASYLAGSKTKFNIKPKSIILRAEKLYPEQRKIIEQTFQCPCFELYGMHEYIILAPECEHHNLHLNFELGIAEVVKDGKVCQPGEEGEIVATTILNYAMPLIRYATGDYGRILAEPCPCGRKSPLIEITGSREKDLIVTRKGYFNVMSGLPVVFGVNGSVEQIQFYQNDIEHLTVRIVRSKEFCAADADKIKAVLSNYLRDSINILFEYVEDIPRTSAGKYKYVESKVPINFKKC